MTEGGSHSGRPGQGAYGFIFRLQRAPERGPGRTLFSEIPGREWLLCPRRPCPKCLLSGSGGDPRTWDRDPTKACASSLHLRLPPSSFLQLHLPGRSAWLPPSWARRASAPRTGCLWAPPSAGHTQAAPALIPADSSANHRDSLAPPCPNRQNAQHEEKGQTAGRTSRLSGMGDSRIRGLRRWGPLKEEYARLPE